MVTGAATVVVLGGGTAMWLAERGTPEGTVRSWGDAIWVTVSTLTTVGYGDHVPTSTAGRFIAAGVMLVGVGIVGAVAAIVALAVARQAAQEEERFLEFEAETLEQRLEVRLDELEAHLAAIDERLRKGFAGPAGSGGGPSGLDDR
jgi:voltage-gated potassium channel